MAKKKKKGKKGDDVFRTCSHCGESVKEKNYERHLRNVHSEGESEPESEVERSVSAKTVRRERKKAEKQEVLERERQKKQDRKMFSALAFIILIIIGGYLGYGILKNMPDKKDNDGYPENIYVRSSVVNGTDEVRIETYTLYDGKADFYYFMANETKVKYFVIQSPDGQYRTAFDACEKCYNQKKGYHQAGDVMVCNSCEQRFSTNFLTTGYSICYPVKLNSMVSNDQVIIKSSDIFNGTKLFDI